MSGLNPGLINTISGTANVNVVNGFDLNTYDYVALVISPTTTETYTFRVGGSGGTVVNTIVIVYTDSTRGTISTVTKT